MMQRVLHLGKIDYLNKGYKNCPVEITLKLTDDNVFTASGTIWNAQKTDCYEGGQCIDTIAKFFPKDEVVNEIKRLWETYHLNDCHAGTPKQESALHKAGLNAFAQDYKLCKTYLEAMQLLIDDGYEFGSGWLKEEIPEKDLVAIKEIILGGYYQ